MIVLKILDERGKEYSVVGDDAVTEAVTDLVRGDLCSALKLVFNHGLFSLILFHKFVIYVLNRMDNFFAVKVGQFVCCLSWQNIKSTAVILQEENLKPH